MGFSNSLSTLRIKNLLLALLHSFKYQTKSDATVLFIIKESKELYFILNIHGQAHYYQ